jgi:hypothetical protein
MTILKFPHKRKNEPPFFKEIREDGYHVYSLDNAKKPNFYPSELPDYPGVPIKDLKENDIVTIRVFIGIGKGEKMRVDGGLIDLRIEFVDKDKVLAAIITQLPKEFPLSTGASIEVFEDEILYRND